jgi:chromosome segregation ATPase
MDQLRKQPFEQILASKNSTIEKLQAQLRQQIDFQNRRHFEPEGDERTLIQDLEQQVASLKALCDSQALTQQTQESTQVLKLKRALRDCQEQLEHAERRLARSEEAAADLRVKVGQKDDALAEFAQRLDSLEKQLVKERTEGAHRAARQLEEQRGQLKQVA